MFHVSGFIDARIYLYLQKLAQAADSPELLYPFEQEKSLGKQFYEVVNRKTASESGSSAKFNSLVLRVKF